MCLLLTECIGSVNRRRPPAAPKPGPGRSLSYVPDHVKNPQRYTCYVLDEPITVGGGDQGTATADGGQADMERVGSPILCFPF